MKRLLLLAALLPAVAFAGAQHDYDNVSIFYSDLQQIGTSSDSTHSDQAVAYTDAVADMSEGIAWCPVGDVSRFQEINAAQNYMGAHREQWNLPARELIVSGLKEAFPCAAKPPSP